MGRSAVLGAVLGYSIGTDDTLLTDAILEFVRSVK